MAGTFKNSTPVSVPVNVSNAELKKKVEALKKAEEAKK